MNNRAPSILVSLFLLPSSYICEGSVSNAIKALSRGRDYFYELLIDRHKIAEACAEIPYWKKTTVLFFFLAATYIQKYGGICPTLVNMLDKFRKLGLKNFIFTILSIIDALSSQGMDGKQKFLFLYDKSTCVDKELISFFHYLKIASYNIDIFAEKCGLFINDIVQLRKIGIYRVFERDYNAPIESYLNKSGNRYTGFVVHISSIKNINFNLIRNICPFGVIFCVCDDSSELNTIDISALAQINHIICNKISLVPEDVSLISVSGLDSTMSIEDKELINFLADCEILPPKCAADFFALQPVTAHIPGSPIISLAIQINEDASVTRNMLAALLVYCEREKLPCEIVFWGRELPEWVSQLRVMWKFINISPDISLEHLSIIEKNCNCEFILVAKDGALLLKGLDSALKTMMQSSVVNFCGCRLLTADNCLYSAGAREIDGHIVLIGEGLSATVPFFKITRSVPLCSLNLLLFRKNIGLFSHERRDLVFSQERGGVIGFTGDSFLTVLCADFEAYLPTTGRPTAATIRKNASDEATAIAAQDIYIPSKVNGTERPIRILYYSPYPSHPASHGNRTTIQFFGRIFKEKGCEVHFALLGQDCLKPEDMAVMCKSWDSVSLLPYPYKDDSHLGIDIPFDGWYENGLGEHIAWLCYQHNIDILFCSYVFQSKMLEFVPRHILKVIDTHDKMSGRYASQKARGVKTEFFSCTPEDEGRYLRRADIVVARREEEARYFNEVSGRNSAIVIPHVEPPHFLERRFERMDAVGLVASANRINLDLVTSFLLAMQSQQTVPPFEVKIAGQVSTMIQEVSPDKREVFHLPWVKLLGFVDDIAEFYASVDLVVAPVTLGTGINVKTVQAMSYGMPLVATTFACKGIETGHPMHSLETIEEVAGAVFNVFEHPYVLENLAECSRTHYRKFYKTSISGFDHLISNLKINL